MSERYVDPALNMPRVAPPDAPRDEPRAANTAHAEEDDSFSGRTILSFLGFVAVITFAAVGWSGWNQMAEERENMEKDLRSCNEKKQVPDPSSISALNHLNEDYCFPVTNIALSETVKYKWKRSDTRWTNENYKRSRREIELATNDTDHDHHEQPAFQGRIIGGELIHVKQYPFFVALWNKGTHICGASILTKDMILTAAHCVYNIVNPMDMEAFFGVSSKTEILNKQAYGHDVHASKIRTIILNPNWDTETYEADNAILELETPIPEWSDFIMPACIHIKDKVSVPAPNLKSGMEVEIIGMGVEEEGSSITNDYLEHISVAMISNNDCNEYFGQNWILKDMICAGHLLGGKDACQGDSGGPLIQTALVEGTPIEWLVGIVSFGVGCARPGLGGAYSSLEYYSQWIADTVNHFKANHQ